MLQRPNFSQITKFYGNRIVQDERRRQDTDRDGFWPDGIANVKITQLCKVGHIDSVDQ